MIALASASDIFAGNENDRGQVKQFISLLTRIAIVARGTFALIAHPSLTGLKGSGISGTTGWHNSVRARAYLEAPKAEDGEQPESDLRQLTFFKNQYGEIGKPITLKWESGLFVPVPDATQFEQAQADAEVDELFLAILRRFNRDRRNASDKSGTSYAPALFAKEPEAGSTSKEAFAAAMRRLFVAGRITNEEYGRSGRTSTRLIERGE
jgi:RecA-family ATPase